MAASSNDIGAWADLAGVVENLSRRCVDGALSARVGTEYETVCDARTAFMLLQTHSQALTNLVLGGPGMSPSGWPIARSMFEVSCRTAWRMLPEDPLEGEARWVRFMRREVERGRVEARWYATTGSGPMSERANHRSDQIEELLGALEGILVQRGYSVPAKEPNLARILDDLGMKGQYFYYQIASERQHGTYVGLEAYTTDLGTARKWGAFAIMADWVAPLTVALRSHLVLGEMFLRRTDVDYHHFALDEAVAEWNAALQQIALEAS